MVGARGFILSIVRSTIPVVTFVAGSITVTIGSFPISSPVPTQITVHDKLGVGEQIVHGIVTTSPESILGHVIVTRTCPDVGFGFAVHSGATGAVASYIMLRVFDVVFGFCAWFTKLHELMIIVTAPSLVGVITAWYVVPVMNTRLVTVPLLTVMSLRVNPDTASLLVMVIVTMVFVGFAPV